MTKGVKVRGQRVSGKFAAPASKRVGQAVHLTSSAKAGKIFAGHRIAGTLSDGTRILEPVAKPSSFTRKEIGDTIRDVLSKNKGKHSLQYAD